MRVLRFVLGALLLLPGMALAQRGGETLTIVGQLTAAEPQVDVLLQVRAGRPLTLTLTSETFDPVLTVLDAAGQVLDANDDNDTAINLPRSQDAALLFMPQTSGTVRVRVSSFASGGAGRYMLTLSGGEILSQPDSLPDDLPLSEGVITNAAGNLVEGRITPAVSEQVYAFRARVGTPVIITAASDAFDTVLEVYDDTGESVAFNDDHSSNLATLARPQDSAVTFTPGATGNFTVAVRSFDESTGRFTLTITGTEFGLGAANAAGGIAPRCDNVISGVAAVSSSFGGMVAENLLDFDDTTGWSSRGDDAAPYLIFELAGGEAVMLNGVLINGYAPSAGFVNSSLRSFEVAVSGIPSTNPADFTPVLRETLPLANEQALFSFESVSARYILLRPLENFGGSYFEASEFNACTSLGGVLTGEPPYTVSGFLQAGVPFDAYRLYAVDGAQMTITLAAEAFDPVLEVYAADGNRLADNDNHPAEFDLPRAQDAALALGISQAGALTIRVRSFAGQGGAYTLNIEGAGLRADDPGAAGAFVCEDVSSAAKGGAVVVASSEFGGRWRAEFLIDGDELTGWASGPAATSAREEYVILDLAGDLRELTGFRINPAATGGDDSSFNVSRFAVLVSDTTFELAAFEQVFSTLLEERYERMLDFAIEPVQARYVMLQTRDTFGGRWHEVAEFVVCAGA